MAAAVLAWLLYQQIIARFIRKITVKAALAAGTAALALLLAWPVNILSLGSEQGIYYGYIVPNTTHNTTSALLKPLALALFLLAVRIFDARFRQAKLPTILGAALLSVLAVLAKPSYTICLLPALILLAGWRWLRHQPVDWRLLGTFVLPAGLALAGQFAFTFGSEEQIVLAPLDFFTRHGITGWQVPLRLLLSVLFPAGVYALFFRQARQDISLNLAGWTLLIGLTYGYLLNETPNASAGNFLWGANIALFIAYIATADFLARQYFSSATDRPSWRVAVGTGLLSLHVIAGVIMTILQITSPGTYV